MGVSVVIVKGSAGSRAYSNAELGIRRGNERLARAATDIALATTAKKPGQSPNQALIDAKAAARSVAASAKALERRNDAIGSFIDTLV